MSELDAKAKEERNAYYREYRKRNREKISENQKRYWQRKAQKNADAETAAGGKAN